MLWATLPGAHADHCHSEWWNQSPEHNSHGSDQFEQRSDSENLSAFSVNHMTTLLSTCNHPSQCWPPQVSNIGINVLYKNRFKCSFLHLQRACWSIARKSFVAIGLMNMTWRQFEKIPFFMHEKCENFNLLKIDKQIMFPTQFFVLNYESEVRFEIACFKNEKWKMKKHTE